MFTPVPGVTYRIDEHTPRDGRKLLVFGTAGWESLQGHSPKSRGWYVAVWTNELTSGYDDDELKSIGGFKTVANNPYRDYIIATHWRLYPEAPDGLVDGDLTDD